ncbi:hypothetical protein [Spiroplasma alleghenense]|uniref:Uncharacterized protein n=1 Tax=Spiroplasma alleghenense TaxID=216931 RepID=A0A345Z435_9MOLU|nr:hypothetical protein [Spiroplasma alleghenense]AXK51364.1 hypothetical protein SALLE_v1c06940 [Spiroplasma alleghenense]
MSNEKIMKNLSKAVFDDFDWITNFFPLNGQVYVSDSNFDNEINLLCEIDKKVLLEEVKIKKPWNRYFLAHPRPKRLNAISASQTDLRICLASPDFVQNIFMFDFSYFVTFVHKDKDITTTHTNRYNGKFELMYQMVGFENHIAISTLINKEIIYLKDNQTRITKRYNFINNTSEELNYKIKKIVESKDGLVVLTDEFEVFTTDKQLENWKIYDDSIFEKQISVFSEEAFLMSDNENGKTYCCFLNESKSRKEIVGKYFYRLESFDRELIIGKPLINRFGEINYYQAPWFIY